MHPLFERRSAGVLAHVSSLPSIHGIGDLGPAAHHFLGWLESAGVGWWQTLPVGPVGPGNSPYSSPSAFAGEPLFISLDFLARDGLLEDSDLTATARLRRGQVDYDAARRFKGPRLEKAHRAFRERGGGESEDYSRFVGENAGWLDGWAEHGGSDPDLVRFLQFQFAKQWSELREEAGRRAVRLMGDLPLFVELGSADVRANPELFRVDGEGRPEVISGAPPDGLSAYGQTWGHPHYAWEEHRRTGFRWWLDRMEMQLARFDAVRVDHFIGFHHAWEVPVGHGTARDGQWGETPGRELLGALAERRGALPLIAEDLGAVTDEVRALRDEFGLPGMRVLHWAFGEGTSYDRPHNLPPHAVVYTGTHDTDTTRGWWNAIGRDERKRVLSYSGGAAATIHWDLLRIAFTSPARTAIAPVQDLLGLDRSARMNRPGLPNGQWAWRLPARRLGTGLARKLRDLVEVSERAAT